MFRNQEMFAVSNDQTNRKNNFQKIKDQVESIKMILRCGICCSTLRDPIMTTCNHAFCRICLFECFKKLSLMRCPVCNVTLNRRSCGSCPLLLSLLEKYLLLAKAFKQDILATDFAKENDFNESQIPMTQAVPSPIPQNQFSKRSVKRRSSHSQHSREKLQRIDDSNYSNMINAEELSNGVKEIQHVGVQTDEKEVQHRSLQIDVEDPVCSPFCAEELNFSSSPTHGGKIQKENYANITDGLTQIESIINSVLEENKNQSRVEVLIKCMPWMPNFLRLSRDEMISALCTVNTEKEDGDVRSPSNNDVDLVIESDEEREVPINTRCTVNYCHSSAQHRKDDNVEYSIRLSPKAKQNDREDNELCHSMMVSGAFKLCDQSLLREFLDYFSSFKLSTSLNRKCKYLVIFNTVGLVCEFLTVKLIYALVNHCTIVSKSWLEDCLNQKTILPTYNCEILLKIDNTLSSATAQRALNNPSTLFHGHVFYVPQTFFNTQLIARDVFLEIVELCGGKTVSHVWELPPERSYIIFATDCFNQDAARRFELDTKKEVLKADWIFASIGQHRILDKKPYRLIHSIS